MTMLVLKLLRQLELSMEVNLSIFHSLCELFLLLDVLLDAN